MSRLLIPAIDYGSGLSLPTANLALQLDPSAEGKVTVGGCRETNGAGTNAFSTSDTDLDITDPSTEKISIEAFVRATNLGSFADLYAGRGWICNFQGGDAIGEWSVGIRSNGALCFLMRESAGSDPDGIKVTSAGVVAINTWYHIMFVWDAGTPYCYVNGSLVAFDGTPSPSAAGWAGREIGRCYSNSNYQFYGRIARLRVWSVAKDATYAVTAYNYGNGLTHAALADTTSLLTSCDLVEASGDAVDATGNMTWTESAVALSVNDGPATETAEDLASTGNHGTLVAAGAVARTQWTSKVIGSSPTEGSFYNTDNDATGIEIPHNSELDLDYTDAFSFAAWINVATSSGWNTIIAKQNDTVDIWFFGLVDEKVVFFIGSQYIATKLVDKKSQASVADGSDHHIAATYDGSNTRAGINIYIDGAAVATDEIWTGTVDASIKNTEVVDICGDHNAVGFGSIVGNVSDIRIYGAELSAAQVSELYAGGDPSGSPTLLAHYPLDDGPNANLKDGDIVLRLASQEGSYYDFFQVNSSQRPQYKTTGANNKPYLLFDGVSDEMSSAVAITQPATVYAVAHWDLDMGVDSYFFDGVDANNHMCLYQNGAGDAFGAWAGLAELTSASLTVGEAVLAEIVFDGGSSKFSINGGTDVTGNPGPDGTGGTLYLATSYAGKRLDGRIYYFLIYSGDPSAAHDADTRTQVRNYLANRFGITLA